MNASCVTILGILGHVIVNWDTKKHKKRRFSAWKFVNSPVTQKPLDVQTWNLDAIRVLMIALRKLSLRVPGHVTKILQVENGQKLTNLNRYIPVITDIEEKCFVSFEHTISKIL